MLDITAKLQGNDCLVIIRDYGAGYPGKRAPVCQRKVFQRKQQYQRHRNRSRAVCDEIIGLHGGRLEINSVYGEGTEVLIVLPAATREII